MQFGSSDHPERDKRHPVIRCLLSLRFVLSMLMLFLYSSGVITWKVSQDAAADAVSDLSDKLMDEIRSHITTALSDQLNVAETITSMNAGLFADGTFSETGIDFFMTSFKTQLQSYHDYVTTVSMTTRIGHLHGVYTDSGGTYTGYWSSNTSSEGKVQLFDYNTTSPLPHELLNDSARFLYVEPDYNSSLQEWYTVTNPSVPGNKSWTSIYTMGSKTPVTMLSESTVAYTPTGLMGVTTIDMALGFAGEFLQNVELPEGYKAFVVDVKDITKFGGVQAIIGTSDDTSLLHCERNETKQAMDGTVDCSSGGEIKFVPVNDSKVEYIETVHEYVVKNFHSWDAVTGHSNKLSVGGASNFISVSILTRANLRWCVVILLPESIYLDNIAETGKWLLIMFVSVMVVKAILSGFVIYFFVAPIQKLSSELELLSEFKMDEATVRLSAWTEIRGLQLTFLSLMRQMKIVKSFLPQALFIKEIESETDDVSKSFYASEVTDTSLERKKHQHRPGLSIRSFEFRRQVTVMSIRVEYNQSIDAVAMHLLHCQVLELVSISAQSNKGVLDQLSGSILHVLWGRDGMINFSGIPETILAIHSTTMPAILYSGATVGVGFTGSAGGDTTRTVSTLTKCREIADNLSLLASEQQTSRFLTTRLIREETELQYKWDIFFVCHFRGTKPACIFKLRQRRPTNKGEWLYTLVGDEDKPGVALDRFGIAISKCEWEAATLLLRDISEREIGKERVQILSTLVDMLDKRSIPSLHFGYRSKSSDDCSNDTKEEEIVRSEEVSSRRSKARTDDGI